MVFGLLRVMLLGGCSHFCIFVIQKIINGLWIVSQVNIASMGCMIAGSLCWDGSTVLALLSAVASTCLCGVVSIL